MALKPHWPTHTRTHTHTHTHRYTKHEEAIEVIAREMGFSHVSLSSAVMPMVRIVQRGYTGRHLRILHIYFIQFLSTLSVFSIACADGYLTPCIFRYVKGFASGFKNPVSIYLVLLHM